MAKYSKTILQWNDIFEKEKISIPDEKKSGNEAFDNSLSWLTENAASIIDFGCASGTLLFLCSLRGTTDHIGIDLSPLAIAHAREKSRMLTGPQFRFLCGGTDSLASIESSSMDAAILSNIIDNLYPEDAHCVLTEIQRILKPGGRLLVKLNSFLTPNQISEYGINVIQDNLLDDGMILWNNSTEEWDNILSSYFFIDRYQIIYYKEHDQYNRLYQLVK